MTTKSNESIRRERAAGGMVYAYQAESIGAHVARNVLQDGVRFALDEAGDFASEVWPATINTPIIDDYESVIYTEGIDLEYYVRNPVVYLDHGWMNDKLPIGRALTIMPYLDGDKSRLETTFVLARGVEDAENARLLMLQRVLTKVSLGFRPIKTDWEDIEVTDEDGRKYNRSILHIRQCRMLEFSVVGMPGNIEAEIGEPARVLKYPSDAAAARAHAAHIVDLINKGKLTVEQTVEATRSLLVNLGWEGMERCVSLVVTLDALRESTRLDAKTRKVLGIVLDGAAEMVESMEQSGHLAANQTPGHTQPGANADAVKQ